ncbi:MAG: hypothetical protein J6B54_06965, partial [Clostridia bacterium]|nr:hypothetical protein [Clostridia bacterium]
MEDIKQVRKDVHSVLALFAVCKALLVLTQRFLGPALYRGLHRVFGDAASQIFSEFSTYATPA